MVLSEARKGLYFLRQIERVGRCVKLFAAPLGAFLLDFGGRNVGIQSIIQKMAFCRL